MADKTSEERFASPYSHTAYAATASSAELERAGRLQVSADGVRFTISAGTSAYECTVTRQALEDLDHAEHGQPDLLRIFLRHRERLEQLAQDLVEQGVRWPHLVIRMQDVRRA